MSFQTQKQLTLIALAQFVFGAMHKQGVALFRKAELGRHVRQAVTTVYKPCQWSSRSRRLQISLGERHSTQGLSLRRTRCTYYIRVDRNRAGPTYPLRLIFAIVHRSHLLGRHRIGASSRALPARTTALPIGADDRPPRRARRTAAGPFEVSAVLQGGAWYVDSLGILAWEYLWQSCAVARPTCLTRSSLTKLT